MKISSKILFLLATICLLSSCGGPNLNINVSSIKVPLNFINLDSIEFNMKDATTAKKTLLAGKLHKDEILSFQFDYCLGIGSVDDDSSYNHLLMFTKDKYFQRVHATVKRQLYPKLPQYNTAIEEGLKHLKHYFPDSLFPQNIIYLNSTFSSSIWSTQHEIGISMERYLSDTTAVIKELPSDPFYKWLRAKFQKKYIPRDALLGWITTHYVPTNKGANMAERIIKFGKALYLLKACLPEEEDEYILRYSHDQYKWARENEWNIWDFMVKQKLLYTSSERDQTNFLNDGPYTAGLPEQGPDRLGQFVGLQMILCYLKEKPKTTMKELINLPYTEIIKYYKVK